MNNITPTPCGNIRTVKMVFNDRTGQHEVPNRTVDFLKGPIPMDWLEIAAALPGKTFHAAMALWRLRGLTKGAPIRFTGAAQKRFSLTRGTAADAIARLEASGLIRVTRHTGRCPVITILPAPKSGEAVVGGDFEENPD